MTRHGSVFSGTPHAVATTLCGMIKDRRIARHRGLRCRTPSGRRLRGKSGLRLAQPGQPPTPGVLGQSGPGRYASPVTTDAFAIVCEVEPATRPDLMHVRHQIGVMSRLASSFLIPDNHIGRATVSSIAVAHEVALMGGRPIACLNARDRNVLGFRRDLLTAAAYGVDEFLFVYGDRPETGRRSDDLTVRKMLEEARRFAAGPDGAARSHGWASARVSFRFRAGSAKPTSCSLR